MASQSPTKSLDPELNPREARLGYLRGWSQLRELLDSGASWSGHERNCVFLNLGNSRYADVSALSGCDFADDGRCVIPSDWDGDGDLDLLLRNRNGPQLRLLRNDGAPPGSSVLVRLVGTKCNRDAIGARVRLKLGQRTLSRWVFCGDAYLSQSSRWLHFGLARSAASGSLEVSWPGGKTESFGRAAAGERLVLVEGSGTAQRVPSTALPLRTEGTLAPGPSETTRLLLRVPLPLPKTLLGELLGDAQSGRPALVNLWSSNCVPCVEELGDWAQGSKELRGAKTEIVILGMDPVAKKKSAEALYAKLSGPAGRGLFLYKAADPRLITSLEVLLRHVRGRDLSIPLPCTFLIDTEGRLQMIALGKVAPAQVADDVRAWGRSGTPAPLRGLWGGRWFSRARRNYPSLSLAFRKAKLFPEARFYQILSKGKRRR